jgi:hypothetical protein
MNPLGANAEHELHLVGNRPRLLEDSGTKARLTFRQASGGGHSKLNDCGWFFVASLRKGVSNAEKKTN